MFLLSFWVFVFFFLAVDLCFPTLAVSQQVSGSFDRITSTSEHCALSHSALFTAHFQKEEISKSVS